MAFVTSQLAFGVISGPRPWWIRTIFGVIGIVTLAVFIPRFVTSDYGEDELGSWNYFKHAAVAANAVECSNIGRDILLKGGNAADATVAALICSGLFSPHSSGIGGGVVIVYYDYKRREKVFFNGRETAPLGATEDMYNGKPLAAQDGGLSIAVPGEVSAMWELHKMCGKLPWAELFKPSIRLAKNGFVIPMALGEVIASEGEHILNNPHLREIFVKEDGSLRKAGDRMTRLKLADTLQKIAEGGKEAFYSGQLADDIILDIAEYGYRFTPDSFSNTEKSALTYHRMIESFKFAFAKKSALGDSEFIEGIKDLIAEMTSQEYADSLRERISDDMTHTFEYYKPAFLDKKDFGTSHVSVIDEEGNACSATSSINLHFGSKTIGNRTGIIFNDSMDDFSQPGEENYYGLPPSLRNFIAPGKMPLSSMAPTICIDSNGKVMQVQGAEGGSRIITAIAATVMLTKWLGDDLKTAIERPRLHDQLLPPTVFYQPGFSQEIMDLLKVKGHNMTHEVIDFSSIVQGITRLDNDWLQAHCDSRKGGLPAGY